MAVGGPPDKLNHRHILMVYMEASGKTSQEMAETLGYHLNRVHTIRRAACYQEKLAEVRAEIEERMIDRVVDLCAAFDREAPHAFQTLQRLHRGREEGVPPAVRRKAAVDILERASTAPKKNVGAASPAPRTISFSARELEDMRQALEEDEQWETLAHMPEPDQPLLLP